MPTRPHPHPKSNPKSTPTLSAPSAPPPASASKPNSPSQPKPNVPVAVEPSTASTHLQYYIANSLSRVGFDGVEGGVLGEVEGLMRGYLSSLVTASIQLAEISSRSNPPSTSALASGSGSGSNNTSTNANANPNPNAASSTSTGTNPSRKGNTALQPIDILHSLSHQHLTRSKKYQRLLGNLRGLSSLEGVVTSRIRLLSPSDGMGAEGAVRGWELLKAMAARSAAATGNSDPGAEPDPNSLDPHSTENPVTYVARLSQVMVRLREEKQWLEGEVEGMERGVGGVVGRGLRGAIRGEVKRGRGRGSAAEKGKGKGKDGEEGMEVDVDAGRSKSIPPPYLPLTLLPSPSHPPSPPPNEDLISLSDSESFPSLPPLRYPSFSSSSSRRKFARAESSGGPVIKLRLTSAGTAAGARGGQGDDDKDGEVVVIRGREKPSYMADVGWVPELPGRHCWRRTMVNDPLAEDSKKPGSSSKQTHLSVETLSYLTSTQSASSSSNPDAPQVMALDLGVVNHHTARLLARQNGGGLKGEGEYDLDEDEDGWGMGGGGGGGTAFKDVAGRGYTLGDEMFDLASGFAAGGGGIRRAAGGGAGGVKRRRWVLPGLTGPGNGKKGTGVGRSLTKRKSREGLRGSSGSIANGEVVDVDMDGSGEAVGAGAGGRTVGLGSVSGRSSRSRRGSMSSSLGGF